MLKTLDNDNRLVVIDGDTEMPSVQQEFATTLYQISRNIEHSGSFERGDPNEVAPDNNDGGHVESHHMNGSIPTAKNNNKMKAPGNLIINLQRWLVLDNMLYCYMPGRLNRR